MVIQTPKHTKSYQPIKTDKKIIQVISETKEISLSDNNFIIKLEIEVISSDSEKLILTHYDILDNGKRVKIEEMRFEAGFKGKILLEPFTKSLLSISGSGTLKIKKLFL